MVVKHVFKAIYLTVNLILIIDNIPLNYKTYNNTLVDRKNYIIRMESPTNIYNSLIVPDAVLLYAKLMLVKSRLPPWIVISFSQS